MDMAHMLLVSIISDHLKHAACSLASDWVYNNINTGIIMGEKYGIAKKAAAIAVKALNDSGYGSSAYV